MNFPIKYLIIIVGFALALLIIIIIMFGFEEAMRFIGLDRVEFIMKVFQHQ